MYEMYINNILCIKLKLYYATGTSITAKEIIDYFIVLTKLTLCYLYFQN